MYLCKCALWRVWMCVDVCGCVLMCVDVDGVCVFRVIMS